MGIVIEHLHDVCTDLLPTVTERTPKVQISIVIVHLHVCVDLRSAGGSEASISCVLASYFLAQSDAFAFSVFASSSSLRRFGGRSLYHHFGHQINLSVPVSKKKKKKRKRKRRK